MTGASLSIARLSKSFGAPQRALKEVDIRLAPGEMVALIGASGSGKSTLLRHIAGLRRRRCAAPARSASATHVMQADGRLAARHPRACAREVGFIFQQFNLVGRLTVMTNVLAGLLAARPRAGAASSAALHARRKRPRPGARCGAVGIEGIAWQRASTLSGGQQQRVAIARALVQRARLILADEPIASLDPESARNVMEILARINREQGITVLVSLHQVQFARRYCPRTVALRLGEVVYDGPSADLDAPTAAPALRHRRRGDARRHRDARRRDERPGARGNARRRAPLASD